MRFFSEKVLGLVCVSIGFLLLGPKVWADSPNELTGEEEAAGFVLLFDGQNLKGWEQDGNWEIVDGAICRASKGGAITYKAATVPDDFELKFQWKVEAGSNSGVYYRPGQYEYQILDNQIHKDGGNPRTSAASLYFCVAPSKDATKPVGEWNTARVVAKGTVVQHWLNGEKVVDIDYADPKFAQDVQRLAERGGDLSARGGNLWLQDHGDPVCFRGLKWRALPADAVLDETPIEPMAVPEEALLKEEAILDRIKKNREAKAKAAKGQ